MNEPAADGTVRGLVDDLFRQRSGQMVATLGRIFGLEHLDLVEDVVQDALVTALRRWPHHGVPDNPGAWLVQVARNRALDQLRRRTNWRGKEASIRHSLDAMVERSAERAGERAAFAGELRDDQLRMIFACCHPALTRDAQAALTLKIVAGFSTDEIARAFLSRKATVAQRVVRAKKALRAAGVELEIPDRDALPSRLDAVLEVVYLMFNEGYAATGGQALVRHDLCLGAIRLAEMLRAAATTAEPRVHALAALLLFQGARLGARTDDEGVPARLDEQDRRRWDRGLIVRGVHALGAAARGETLSRYHLEAEIAACHVLPARAEDTDWRQILDGYDALLALHPSPVIALNRAVALAEVDGPAAGLDALAPLVQNHGLAEYPLLWATRGELLARLGRHRDAAHDLARARALGTNAQADRFLALRADQIAATAVPAG